MAKGKIVQSVQNVSKSAPVAPTAPVAPVVAKKPVVPGRPVLYPNVGVAIRATEEQLGFNLSTVQRMFSELNKVVPNLFEVKEPLTADEAKQILGWQTESEYIAEEKEKNPEAKDEDLAWGTDFFLTDTLGNKVRLRYNTNNRPWSREVSSAYAQDVLKCHWKYNGESMIIGKHGDVLSGQHRLIGLVFAQQKLDGPEKPHWEKYWKNPVVSMPCNITYGVDQSSEVTRTIDNVKARTLSDVFFADSTVFHDLKADERKYYVRVLDYAVKLLWDRTGEKNDAWTPTRTHSESMTFIDNHPKIKECLRYIMEEDAKGVGSRISRFLPLGHAVGLMYLMGSSGTPDNVADDYHASRMTGATNEASLNWDRLKKARAFFSDLSAPDDEALKYLRLAHRPVAGDVDSFSGFVFQGGEGEGTVSEKVGCLIKAWNLYCEDTPIGEEDVDLVYRRVEPLAEGLPHTFVQLEFPTIRGGIDIGNAPKVKPEKVKKNTPEAEGDIEGGDDNEDGTTVTSQTNSAMDETRAQWANDKSAYGGAIILYSSKTRQGDYFTVFEDAETFNNLTGVIMVEHPVTKIPRVVIGAKELDSDCAKVAASGEGIKIMLCQVGDNNERSFSEWKAASAEPTQPNQNGEAPKKKSVVVRKK